MCFSLSMYCVTHYYLYIPCSLTPNVDTCDAPSHDLLQKILILMVRLNIPMR